MQKKLQKIEEDKAKNEKEILEKKVRENEKAKTKAIGGGKEKKRSVRKWLLLFSGLFRNKTSTKRFRFERYVIIPWYRKTFKRKMEKTRSAMSFINESNV